MKTCIFAGTFDPLSTGHESIIKKALKEFGKVLIVIGENSGKTPFFSATERLSIINARYKNNKKIKVVLYSDYGDGYYGFLKSENAYDYIRGIRNDEDLKYEKEYEKVNAEKYPDVKTHYIYCDGKFKGVSSSEIRRRIEEGKSISKFVSVRVRAEIKRILKKNKR